MEFHDTNFLYAQQNSRIREGEVVWKPPDSGWYKINTNVAINKLGKKIGFGIVIRDATGSVVASSSQSVIATLSPQVAEAEAILRGLHLARGLGLLLVTIESDAAMVVKWTNKGSHCGADVGLVLDDIVAMSRSLGCGLISFVPQKANQVVHFLA
ncbi:hypothetical protein Dsin_009969 [Dipteronia sinensis]|uniref:RNase H type-1 domain-containing protein n=1 Tax=Dipteronia sinensis TaxID=43782 RepID=A0AAE0ASW2_9ROSI|nr:hypothetical protein Dsin_009969 [Dipteronia sinensis]